MNIILLSGGSGKRLWPLSNEVRSKQFIQLFWDKQSGYESMMQRIFRQILTVDPSAMITIATNKNQAGTIRNQLGDQVNICIEPDRRDSFPAIALASAYLKYELQRKDDDVVVVCPVDSYVDMSFFNAVKELEALVKRTSVNLTLMGKAPAYPCEKFGYIIPETHSPVSPVMRFVEKPDRDRAAAYISEGALWNMGVFAFRLEYLLSIARSFIDFTDYRDLYAKYSEMEKISFDYAVAENEKSIQVMRYEGSWDDVGTWSTLTEVMAEPVIGNAVIDETCENTNVINELDVPVLCMGCKDMVVAVSGDGILVADKERSTAMKPFVEKIGSGSRFAEAAWGEYRVIDAQPGSITAKLHLKSGHKMSYHSHEFRDEAWNVIAGKGRTIVDGIEADVSTGDVVMMAAGCAHTLIAETDMDVIEVQVGNEVSREDKKIIPLEIE